MTLASSFYFVDLFSEGEEFSSDIVILMVGMFFIQLIFFSIGALVAGASRRPRSAASTATSIMFLTFLLYYLANFNQDLSFIEYLTPFKYFDAAVLMVDGLDPVFVALSVVIVGAAMFGTYRLYSARDLTI